MRLVALTALILFAGCSSIDYSHKAEGWPEMKIVKHYVPHNEMRDRCMKYVGLWDSPEACAEFDFKNRQCDIWFSSDFPPAPFVVAHEEAHCKGFGHK